jgi:hypothetical protein
MNKAVIITLQGIGALSILPYPFVLVANVMAMAAPGRTARTTAFWALLSLYPLVWIGLDVVAWRAMSRGAVALAIGLSSIPAIVTAAAGVYVFRPTAVPTIQTTNQQNELALSAALRDFTIGADGAIGKQQDRAGVIRRLVDSGVRLDPAEATNLRKSWLVRRAVYQGAVRTREENPLVWRIVNPKPAAVSDTGFSLAPADLPLLNRPTSLHGTPLYAALLVHASGACGVIIAAGGRLSGDEERDPAATSALENLFDREPELRAAYSRAR